jgi:hypothetical protein
MSHTTPGNRAGLLADLRQTPLGGISKEAGLQNPINLKPAQAVYYARNLSATRERKHVEKIASIRTVPADILTAPGMTEGVEAVKQAINAGDDYNRYVVGVQPMHRYLTSDSDKYLIPYKTLSPDTVDARSGEECDAPWIGIPEAVFYLYYGNWEMLNTGDDREYTGEIERLNARFGSGRANIYVRHDREGNEIDNPFAYIEFMREEIKTAPVSGDVRKLFAKGELVEM